MVKMMQKNKNKKRKEKKKKKEGKEEIATLHELKAFQHVSCPAYLRQPDSLKTKTK